MASSCNRFFQAKKVLGPRTSRSYDSQRAHPRSRRRRNPAGANARTRSSMQLVSTRNVTGTFGAVGSGFGAIPASATALSRILRALAFLPRRCVRNALNRDPQRRESFAVVERDRRAEAEESDARRRRRRTFSSMTSRASGTLASARWFRRRSAVASSRRLALDRTCFRFGVRGRWSRWRRFDSSCGVSANARVLRIHPPAGRGAK